MVLDTVVGDLAVEFQHGWEMREGEHEKNVNESQWTGARSPDACAVHGEAMRGV